MSEETTAFVATVAMIVTVVSILILIGAFG